MATVAFETNSSYVLGIKFKSKINQFDPNVLIS